MTGPTVDYFPYAPGLNPYQAHFKNALEQAGAQVAAIPPRKLFPVTALARASGAVAQVDWISDLYVGRNSLSALTKRLMFAAGLRQLARRRVVWTVHNLFTHDSPLSTQREAEFIQAFVRCCSGLLFLSASSMEEFARNNRVAERVLMRHALHGHYADDYPNDGDLDRARQILGIAADQRVVLLMGRLHAYKGVEELLAAFTQVATVYDTLLIAGEPSSLAYGQQLRDLAHSLQPRCSGHIRVVPKRVSPGQMQDYFNGSDVTVMPFRNLLNSGSLLLAASFGLPVVAPAIGSVPEYVPSEVGWVYDPGAADLAEVVRSALDSAPEDRAGRAKRTEFVRSRFSWAELAATAISVYEDVLGVDRP